MTETKWWVSTDLIGKPGSPKTAGPFSTREDASAARKALEAMGANLSVFEEEVTPAVDLPTSGTHLGWLTHQGVRSLLAFDFHSQKWVEDASFGAVSRESVEAWMPAVAVPKEAFDALDAHYEHRVEVADVFGASAWNESLKAIDIFLGRVDLANGGTR